MQCVRPLLVDDLADLTICGEGRSALRPAVARRQQPRKGPARGARLREGLRVTVASDDPALFGTDMLTELQRCAEAFGWDRETVTTICAEGLALAGVTSNAG